MSSEIEFRKAVKFGAKGGRKNNFTDWVRLYSST